MTVAQAVAQNLLHEVFVRFVLGGIIVSVFAILGNLCKPQIFAGIFGAAPSVALATLALTFARNGPEYARLEARSMLAGAVAFGCYCLAVVALLLRRRLSALPATLSSIPVWFAVAFCLWAVFLK